MMWVGSIGGICDVAGRPCCPQRKYFLLHPSGVGRSSRNYQHRINARAIARTSRSRIRYLVGSPFAGIGTPKRQREPWPVIVKRVGDAVQFPQFELTLSDALGFKQGNRGFPNVLL